MLLFDHPLMLVGMTSVLGQLKNTLDGLSGDPDLDCLDALASRIESSIAAWSDDTSPSEKSTYFRVKARVHHLRYQHFQVKGDLGEALTCAKEAVELLPDDHPDRVEALYTLVRVRRARFSYFHQKKDLKELCRIAEELLALCPAGHSGHAAALENTAEDFRAVYEVTGDESNLEAAISVLEQVLAVRVDKSPERFATLGSLASSHMELWRSRRDRTHIDNALALYEERLAQCSCDEEEELRLRCLDDLAAAMMSRYNAFEDPEDLAAAVRTREELVGHFPVGHAERTRYLADYVRSLHSKAIQSKDPASFDHLISLYQELYDTIQPHDPRRASSLTSFTDALDYKANLFGWSAENVGEYIRLREEAFSLSSEQDRDYDYRLTSLASALNLQSEQKDMTRIIALRQQALAYVQEGTSEWADLVIDLGTSLEELHAKTDAIELLVEAISFYDKVVNANILGDADSRIEHLLKLGCALYKLIERRGADRATSQRLIALHEEALELSPQPWDQRARLCGYLARAYQAGHTFSWKSDYMDKAAALYKEAVDQSSDKPSEQALYMWYQARVLVIIYQLYRDADTLEDGLHWIQAALDQAGNDHPQRALMTCDLANALCHKFRHGGDRENLDTVISILATNLEREMSKENKLACLVAMGSALRTRYGALFESGDLDRAITVLEEAILLGEKGRFAWANAMTGLSKALLDRYQQADKVSDIARAIDVQQQVLHEYPSSNPDYTTYVSQDVEMLLTQYRQTSDLSCLEEARRLCGETFTSSSADEGVDYLQFLATYCRVLRLSYTEVPDSRTLEDLVSTGKRMLDAQEAQRPNYISALLLGTGASLVNMGGAFIDAGPDCSQFLGDFYDRKIVLDKMTEECLTRFQISHRVEDIDDALALYRDALTWLPRESPLPSGVMFDMADAWRRRFEQSQDKQDLDSAIVAAQSSLEFALPESARMIRSLGTAQLLIARHTMEDGNRKELKRAWDLLVVTVVNSQHCSISVRFHAAMRLALHSGLSGFADYALYGYRTLFDLLPHLAWLNADTLASLHAINQARFLPVEAAMFALRHSTVEEAIQFLEAGRSVIWTQATRLRRPLDDVEAVSPELASRLKELGRRLQSAGQDPQTAPEHSASESLASLRARWNETVDEVRRQPGFDLFLRPKPYSVLSQAARDGPVIILVDHESCCAAIIIESPDAEPTCIPLTMAVKKLKTLHVDLQSSANSRGKDDLDDVGGDISNTRAAGPRPRRQAKPKPGADLLAVLWDEVARPIMEHLCGYSKPAPEDRRRLWWCCMGHFSWIPIHAAGRYDGPNAISVSDFFMSAYTPTLDALIEARKRSIADNFNVLAAVYPKPSPGFSRPLPSVKKELEEIYKIVPAESIVSLNENGQSDPDGVYSTPENVLSNLPLASVLHLACHGDQDTSNPLRSCFILRDGKRLTVERIMEKSLPYASIAFLSACHTASNNEETPDEAINLANAMLFAGFPTVVATMWPMEDQQGPKLARAIYSQLFNGQDVSTQTARSRAIAVALDAFVRESRKTLPWQVWAVFIQLGA